MRGEYASSFFARNVGEIKISAILPLSFSDVYAPAESQRYGAEFYYKRKSMTETRNLENASFYLAPFLEIVVLKYNLLSNIGIIVLKYYSLSNERTAKYLTNVQCLV